MRENEILAEIGVEIKNVIEKPGRLYFDIQKSCIKDTADYLFNKAGCRLSTATGQETYQGIEITYHFSHDADGQYYCPRVLIPDKKHPVIDSITPLFIGAEWIEREISEMFGVEFIGLPNPEPLLTGNNPADLLTPWLHRRNNE